MYKRQDLNGAVELGTRISVRLIEHDLDRETGVKTPRRRFVEATTVGRALMSEILPAGLSFDHINKALKKKEIARLINASFRKCGLRETVIFVDRLMQTGFRLATRGGISIAIDDMLIPSRKVGILAEAEAQVKEIEQQSVLGPVTQGEGYNKGAVPLTQLKLPNNREW